MIFDIDLIELCFECIILLFLIIDNLVFVNNLLIEVVDSLLKLLFC